MCFLENEVKNKERGGCDFPCLTLLMHPMDNGDYKMLKELRLQL